MPLFALPFPMIDPVLISVGPFAIRWYALAYVGGLIGGWWMARRVAAAKQYWGGVSPARPEDVDDLIVWAALGVVLGGRTGYVLFYKPAYYLAHPTEILAVWQGGMAFHGGFLGVLVAMWLFGRKTQRPWLAVTDFIAPLVPTGLAAGRMGNFINGELCRFKKATGCKATSKRNHRRHPWVELCFSS